MHRRIRASALHGLKTESLPFEGAFIIDNIRLFGAAMMACASLAAQAQSPAGDAAPDTHWKFGVQVGSVHDGSRSEPVVQLGFGYDIDRIWSVEVLAATNALFVRDGGQNVGDYEFDYAAGARVLAALPLSQRWSLVGGLGVMQLHEVRGLAIDGDSRKRTEAMVSLAAMYRANRHWAMGVEASTFAQSHTLDLGLRGEIHF